MKKNTFYFFIIILFLPLGLLAQEDDMMDMFADEKPTTDYTFATFKTTRVVIGQSIENPANGNLIFDIQHRFGTLNTGFKEFFGLDRSTTIFLLPGLTLCETICLPAMSVINSSAPFNNSSFT